MKPAKSFGWMLGWLALSALAISCSGTTTLVAEPLGDGGADGAGDGLSPDGFTLDAVSLDVASPDGLSDGATDGGGCGPNLTGIVRDFKDSHPDFEKFEGTDHDIVTNLLGADYKPIYKNKDGTSLTTSGKANFDQWYRNVDGVNMNFPFKLEFKPGSKPGISTFESATFFPADDKGFGNQGRAHNFHFTFELHTEFVYRGGEVFTFRGDDDVFTYINGKLALDLGGVHVVQEASVNLDEKAKELGLEKGKTYGLSVFQAERHTVESNFRIDTTIQFTNCGPIIR